METTLAGVGRTEPKDLESWIKANPEILGENILIIGEQVQTRSGPLDLFGIDKSGNTVIIELKRDKIPREALAQAIDYASDAASWDFDKLNEICLAYTKFPLDEYLSENFKDIDLENISFNQTQRILLVGFFIEEPLQRMVEWLSEEYELAINYLVLRYIKSEGGDELIARTMIIPEVEEQEKVRHKQRKGWQMSNLPGNYNSEELIKILIDYLSQDKPTPNRIRKILLPLCLKHEFVAKEQIIEEFDKQGEQGRLESLFGAIIKEWGYPPRDYLRQIVEYKKDATGNTGFKIIEEYRNMIKDILEEMKK